MKAAAAPPIRMRTFSILMALVAACSTAAAQSGPPLLAGELRIMAGPLAQDVTDRAATVFWLSSRRAAMHLKYGLSAEHPDQSGGADRWASREGQEHRIRLANLQPDQTYFFQIFGPDGSVRAHGQFQTESPGHVASARLKIIDGPVFEYLDSTSVQIAWTTDKQSSTLVRYGTDPNNLRKIAEAPWGQQTHRVTITGLDPNTTYYFVAESGQASDSGTMAKSSEGSFRTEYTGESALTNIEPPR